MAQPLPTTAPRLETCPHGPRCVPCPLRGRPYRQQLATKTRRLREALAAHSSLRSLQPEPIVGSRDLFGYRNNAKLVVRAGSAGHLRLGVYAPGTHRLVEARACRVQHPAITSVLEAFVREAERAGLRPYDERTHHGDLRYVFARYSRSTRSVLLVPVTRSRTAPGLDEVVRRLARKTRGLAGIVQNVNPERGNVILGSRFHTLRPRATLMERVGFLKLQVSAGAFLQSNVWTARRLYETALQWGDPGSRDHVLDLFCGIGPLALHLATKARHVIGIEETSSAVGDARSNARRNGFANTRFLQGSVEETLDRLAPQIPRPFLVSLNPPRKGVSRDVAQRLADLGPERLLYVSCDPDTLARDLDVLARFGYRTTRIRPFDMLPQTEHVEVLAQLDRMGD